jgi:hypothetical protein
LQQTKHIARSVKLSSSKVPKQEWIDNLLDIVSKELDPVVVASYQKWVSIREEFSKNYLSETDARLMMNELKTEILEQSTLTKHRTEKLISALIEYIINPKLQIRP